MSKLIDESSEHQPRPMPVSTDFLWRRVKDRGDLVDWQQEKVAQDERTAGLIVDAFERFAEEPRDFNPARGVAVQREPAALARDETAGTRSEEHTSELQAPM